MRVFYQFDYDTLPRNVRKQLAKSIANPDYLVSASAVTNKTWFVLHSLLVAVCGYFIYLAAADNFGNPLNDTSWSEPEYIIWYAILFFGVIYGMYAIWQRTQLHQKFRFLPGQYLFPMALVDARSNKITVHDLTQMRKLDAVIHEHNGNYKKTVFNFNFNDGTRKSLTYTNKSRAELALENFNRFQNNARAAFQNRDIAKLHGFDPFLELRKIKWKHSLHESNTGIGKKALGWFFELKLHLIMLAILIAALFWYGRTAASDKKMYLNAKQMQTEKAYVGYISRGKYHVAELQAELPRVVFNEVQKRGSVTMLRNLKLRFPQSDIQADVNEEIHQLYEQALQKFRSQASKSDAGLVHSMESLLKFAEEHDDPNVLISFSRPSASDLEQLDTFLKNREQRLHGRKIIPAAKYFADDSAATREARIVSGVRTAFSTIFTNDVLAFGAGLGPGKPHPSLQIAYQIEPSGNVYSSEKQDDAFVGLIMRFKAAIVVPDMNERWKFDLEVEPPDSFNVNYKTSGNKAADRIPEGQVYAVMAERAFDKLEIKIKEAFFRPDSSVFIRQMKHKT